ncbi:12331_t:CDS:2 [Ambispora gerdemannii]|uniref:12331_t:CDS:1 n=1 Tax=Ambispora gerdemannii TaxID=144530 RepID=A0A9N9BT39_9GLOM|nr:12331_t:CDS:2 [Ambispora gerdemannii]
MPSNILNEVLFVDIDGVVNPAMLHAHVMLLIKFKALEQSDEHIDTRYLLRAQERYVLWLNLLGSQKYDQGTELIPPIGAVYITLFIDVCYIWHSHLLSPLRYYEDLHRIYDPQQKFPDFPLKQLYDVWESNGDHTDPPSEKVWVEETKQPWILDPNDSSDFKIICPWCKSSVQIPWVNYVKLMQTVETDESCPKCYAPYSIETLSAKRFVDDISAWNKDKTRLIGGTLINRKNGTYSEEFATRSFQSLFTTSSINELTNFDQYNWEHIVKQLNFQIKNSEEKIVQRVLSAYIGIPLAFSIDLISAVRRQRKFTDKVVNNKWVDCVGAQENATVRYLKFLSLTKEKPSIPLVPTFDIDLCWHTHQIHASLYRAFTKKHAGRIINHDDTLPEKELSVGFEATVQAWNKIYNEPYVQSQSKHPKEYEVNEECGEQCQQCQSECGPEACYCD